MKLDDAIRRDATRMKTEELLEGIILLKRAYRNAETQFDKVGQKSYILDRTQKEIEKSKPIEKIEEKGLFHFKDGKREPTVSTNELKSIYSTYQGFFGRWQYYYDSNNELKKKYLKYKGATVKGNQQIQETTAQTLGFNGYTSLSQQEQGDIWDIIGKAKQTLTTLSTSYHFQSGQDLKTMASWINSGIDDPTLIAKLLALKIDNSTFDDMYKIRYAQREVIKKENAPIYKERNKLLKNETNKHKQNKIHKQYDKKITDLREYPLIKPKMVINAVRDNNFSSKNELYKYFNLPTEGLKETSNLNMPNID